MKCDKLKVYVPQDGPWGLEPEEGGKLVEEETCYLKSEVDAAIAELKAEIRRKEGVEQRWFERCMEERTENAELKQKLGAVNELVKETREWLIESQKMHQRCADNASKQIRRLKRALYKACANWADVVAFEETEGIGHDNSVAERWRKMERRCLKKVEEYK